MSARIYIGDKIYSVIEGVKDYALSEYDIKTDRYKEHLFIPKYYLEVCVPMIQHMINTNYDCLNKRNLENTNSTSMIKRLGFKKNTRVLAVQWNGTNISECVNFSKLCHYSHGNLYIYIYNSLIQVNVSDWIIKLTDDEYNIITNKTYSYLFEEKRVTDTSDVKADVQPTPLPAATEGSEPTN